MKTLLKCLLSLVAMASLQAQAPGGGIAQDIILARQRNAQLMQQYSWNCRTEIKENGVTKDTRIDTVTWGPNNQPQHTLLSDDANPLPRGFLIRRIEERERQRTEEYLQGLRTFLHQYALPTAGQVQLFIGSASIPPPGPNGILQLSGGSVVVPGDTLSLWVYAPTKQTRRMNLMTTYQGDSITVTATWKSLSNGLNYMAYAQVDIPDKGMTVLLQNYDYINQNQ